MTKRIAVFFIVAIICLFHFDASCKSISLSHKSDLQSQLSLSNSRIVVKKTFNLDGKTITIPEGCSLEIKKGGFENGTIIFNNTKISTKEKPFFFDIEPLGTITSKVKYSSWFHYSDEHHDDWNMFAILLSTQGEIVLSNRLYNIPKHLHSGTVIYVKKNTIIQGNGAVLNIGYSAQNSYESLFNLTECTDVSFRNIIIEGEINTTVDAPAGHSGSYSSNGVMVFYLNNNCNRVSFESVRCISVGYGIKTSRYSNYHQEAIFKDISIENCHFEADMPIQGNGFAKLIASKSSFISRGTNGGNHAVYILNNLNPERSQEETAIVFDDCIFESKQGDGQCVQIYDARDIDKCLTSRLAQFNKCTFSTYNNGIVSSISAKIEINNSVLANKMITVYNSIGDLEFNDCRLENVSLYHAIANNCIISGDNIVGGNNTNYGPVILKGCRITADKYLIYNNTDECVPVIDNCDITVNGDGIISQRNSQQEPIEFSNCKFNIKGRISYSPNKTTTNTFKFVDCEIESKNPDLMYLTNSGLRINIVFENCKNKGRFIEKQSVKK